MEQLVWVFLGVLCGLSGAYSAWNTIPRAPNHWTILVAVGGGSGWLGGAVTSWMGLAPLGWLTAIGAGYLVTGWVFANLRGVVVSHHDLGDQVDLGAERHDRGDRLRDHGAH